MKKINDRFKFKLEICNHDLGGFKCCAIFFDSTDQRCCKRQRTIQELHDSEFELVI